MLLACWPALAGAAEKGRSWITSTDAKGTTLSYATPETDDGLIAFRCTRVTKQLTVVVAMEPMGAKDGMRIGVDLIAEGVGNVLLQAVGRRLQLDDTFIVEAKTTLGPALRRILTEGQTLSIMVQDGTEEIPLSGAAKGVAALIEACGR
jgi:hypothetical protein